MGYEYYFEISFDEDVSKTTQYLVRLCWNGFLGDSIDVDLGVMISPDQKWRGQEKALLELISRVLLPGETVHVDFTGEGDQTWRETVLSRSDSRKRLVGNTG